MMLLHTEVRQNYIIHNIVCSKCSAHQSSISAPMRGTKSRDPSKHFQPLYNIHFAERCDGVMQVAGN